MSAFENLDEVMKYFSTSGAFLTAKSESGEVNTMAVSWGFIGNIWNKPHFICFVRPQRHTQKIFETAADFTISLPFGTMRDELKICGTKSGRDINKAEVVQFIPSKSVSSPVVSGCNAYYECVIHSRDKFEEERMSEFAKSFYDKDYHYIYVGEIRESYFA